MSSILVILLIATLNMLPAHVQKFALEMSADTTALFARQPDGGWTGRAEDGEVLGTFYVNGTKMTVKFQGQEHTDDFAKLLGVDEKVDWKTIRELKLGGSPLLIERKPAGIDFVLKHQNQGRDETKLFNVRWEPGKTE